MNITHDAGAPPGSSSTAGEAQRPATRFLAAPPPPPGPPLHHDPRVMDFVAQLAAAEEEGRELFVIALQPRHAQYLRDRAANHGETPERHLETILRNFRSYHDDRRPEHRQAPPEPGMPAITRRA